MPCDFSAAINGEGACACLCVCVSVCVCVLICWSGSWYEPAHHEPSHGRLYDREECRKCSDRRELVAPKGNDVEHEVAEERALQLHRTALEHLCVTAQCLAQAQAHITWGNAHICGRPYICDVVTAQHLCTAPYTYTLHLSMRNTFALHLSPAPYNAQHLAQAQANVMPHKPDSFKRAHIHTYMYTHTRAHTYSHTRRQAKKQPPGAMGPLRRLWQVPCRHALREEC
eukprot:scaffold167043_cov26-Tisochrysis_lutea.AAC.1